MKLILCLLLPLAVSAQSAHQAGLLRGQVSDQNGAAVAGAKVTVHGPSGFVQTTTTDAGGWYSFANLPPGDYTVDASAPSLVLADSAKITLGSPPQTLNLQLTVFMPEQKITVEEDNRAAI